MSGNVWNVLLKWHNPKLFGYFWATPFVGSCLFYLNHNPMANYLVIGRDGSDEQALDRRMAHRPDHLAGAKEMKSKGQFILGGAMLSEEGNMLGSAMVVSFDTPEELQAWLDREPYISGKVWATYEVFPFRIADV